MSKSAWTAQQVSDLPAVVDVVTAGSVLGLGRTTARELARTGAFPVPVLRLGQQYRVPSAALKRLVLGSEESETGPDSLAIATTSTTTAPAPLHAAESSCRG